MKTVLIFIENFYPAYKAGGPIQSITNLIIALENKYTFKVVTSAYDLQEVDPLKDITLNTWNQVCLPSSKKNISVWYTGKNIRVYTLFKSLLKDIQPDYIYLNGIFSIRFFLMPLITNKTSKIKSKLIICPRGMLQRGAISGKYLKKKFYLKFLGLSGLLTKVLWHATNEEEKDDIQKQINSHSSVVIAKNIPKPPLVPVHFIQKPVHNLQLVYLSLIAEKKNLLLLIETVTKVESISLDIYGPVKDKEYWNKCRKLINLAPHRIKYKGDILPSKVQETFAQYHASVLLTKGENFGHALYESLSAGRPIITSRYTPWNNLSSLMAGWNVDINNEADCIAAYKELEAMPQDKYTEFCEGAHRLAINYYNSTEFNKSYSTLFN